MSIMSDLRLTDDCSDTCSCGCGGIGRHVQRATTRIPNSSGRVFSWEYAGNKTFVVTRYGVAIEECASGVEARDKANRLEAQFNEESGVTFVEQSSPWKRRNRRNG
jgi:hypothetical protein